MSDKNPKIYFHNVPVEICSSAQEGLPFAATPYIKAIFESALAAAANRYPITICHFVLMANHFHLLAIVHDPSQVHDFVRYLKVETAHAINNLLDRNQRSVWIEGFDSPLILTAAKFLERMLYSYLNPAKANLVASIKDYPGLNTYEALFRSDKYERCCKRFPRNAVRPLPSHKMSLDEQQEFTDSLMKRSDVEQLLTFEPWAWLKCFPEETKDWDLETVKKEFFQKLESAELELRSKASGPCLGANALRLQDPRAPYQSKRRGLKMICLCSCVEMRKRFISNYKSQKTLAKSAFQAWKRGDFSIKPPPGFFAPGGILLASALLFAFL